MTKIIMQRTMQILFAIALGLALYWDISYQLTMIKF